jgi:hypothetical protein
MQGDLVHSIFSKMMILGEGRTKRISSYDRTGGNMDSVKVPANGKVTLAEIDGPACINHLYFAVSCADRLYYRRTLLRIFWDGEREPSVDVPLGDFFGVSHCRVRYFNSLLLCVNPGYNPGMNSYFPMPFSKQSKIEVVNEGDEPLNNLYFHIDYEELPTLDDDVGTFHAQWRRENPTRAVLPKGGRLEDRYSEGVNLTGDENYVILEAEGSGNYVGCVLNVDNLEGGWWGEGDDMVFVDGERWPPSLHGTGTEEVFGGGWCPAVEYATPYTGFSLITKADWSGKISMYRFHVTDPVRFHKSVRVTVEHGHANNLSNDYSSVGYWYQKEPHAKFPAMPPVMERLPGEGKPFWDLYEKEKRLWHVLYDQSERGVRWKNYSWEEQWKVRDMISQVNKAYASDDYDKMDKLLDNIVKIIMKHE